MKRVRRLVGLVVAFWVGAGASGGAAQEVSLGAGVSQYDLSGTGTSWVAGARYLHALAPRFDLEAGASVFRYDVQLGTKQTLFLPEVALHFHPPLGWVPLYLAAGGGLSIPVEGDGETEPTLFAAVGFRLRSAAGWTVRPEMRIRAVDPWTGTMADFTLSLGRSLPF